MKKNPQICIYIFLFIIIILGIGGYFYYKSRNREESISDAKTPEESLEKKKEKSKQGERKYVSDEKETKVDKWGKKVEYEVDVTCGNEHDLVFDTQTMNCIQKPKCEKLKTSNEYNSITTFRVDKKSVGYNKCVDSAECSKTYDDNKGKMTEEERKKNLRNAQKNIGEVVILISIRVMIQ